MLLWWLAAHAATVDGISLGPAPEGASCLASVEGGAVTELACSGAPSLLIASLVGGWTVPEEPSLLTVTQTEAGPEVTVEPALPVVTPERLVVKAVPASPEAVGWTGSCLLRLRVSETGQVTGAYSAPQVLRGTGPQPPECPPAAEAAAEAHARAVTFKPPKVDGARVDVLTTLTVTFAP